MVDETYRFAPEELAIHHGWLLVKVHGCTCDGGQPFGHRPDCGYEPVMTTVELAQLLNTTLPVTAPVADPPPTTEAVTDARRADRD